MMTKEAGGAGASGDDLLLTTREPHPCRIKDQPLLCRYDKQCGHTIVILSVAAVTHCGHTLPGAQRGRTVAVSSTVPGRSAV